MWQKGQRKKRLQQARELYEQGYSVEGMAREMNVTVSTVYGYIAELGLKKKKYQDTQKKVIDMYTEGKKVSEISETLGVSVSFIHKEIKKAGLKPRKEFVTFVTSESSLINEKTIFADNSVKIESLVINGKRYQDVTQIFGGR